MTESQTERKMKRRNRKIACLLLAAVMVLFSCSACFFSGGGDETTETEDSAAEPTEISAEELTSYKIIRSEEADEETIAAASKLFFTLNRKYGIKMTFETDYVGRGESVPVGTKEILVGETNRPESVGVRWSDFRVASVNDRVVIAGGSGAAVAQGVDWFLENCLENGGLKVPALHATKKTYRLENLTLGGVPLKDYAVAKIAGDDDDALRAWLGEQVGILNVSDREIRLSTDETLLIAELSATAREGNVILSVSPKQADFAYVTERFMKLVRDTAEAGKTEIVLFGKENMALESQYKQLTQADMTALRKSTDDRVEEIRNTPNMTIPSGAKVYYVSNSGSDSNNGTSPQTPWKTIAKVNSANLPRDSYVCFKRGDLWRETLMADKAGVTYTAYGTGEKPIIYGSPVNGADPALWVETETPNVWKWTGQALDDVGTMVFNEGAAYAVKAILRVEKTGSITQFYNHTTGDPFNNFQKDLNTDLHFYHDVTAKVYVNGSAYTHTGTGNLYLYSTEGNPGSRFRSIEFNEYKNLVTVKANNVTFDNLCIKYTGIHGIGTSRSDAQIGLTVTNCEFGWIGGSAHTSSISGRNYQTRLGNAIEIYGGCDGFYCENNYIYQVFDAGISVQANYNNVGSSYLNSATGRKEIYMKNVRYLNNVIENCEMPIENWMSSIPASDPSRFEHVLIEGNHIWYAGYGLCESRPPIDRAWNAAIKNRCSATGNRAYDYQIRNNLIAMWKYRALQITSNLFNPEDGSDSVAKFSGNTYVGEYGKKFGQVEVVIGSENHDHIDGLFNFDTAQYMTEHKDETRGSYLKDHSDGTDQFWFAP